MCANNMSQCSLAHRGVWLNSNCSVITDEKHGQSLGREEIAASFRRFGCSLRPILICEKVKRPLTTTVQNQFDPPSFLLPLTIGTCWAKGLEPPTSSTVGSVPVRRTSHITRQLRTQTTAGNHKCC